MKKFFYCATCLILLSACSLSANGAIIQAQDALEEGNWDKALHDASNAERYYTDPPLKLRKKALLIKAHAYEGKGDKVAAKATYQYIYDRFPESEEGYIAKAKLSK